ncbi:MAG: phosphatase PAP2 family protein [Acidimicrobiia bacterium]|nr:phosphatase PAP2 family protein [Acidimicrobiia bacterium]
MTEPFAARHTLPRHHGLAVAVITSVVAVVSSLIALEGRVPGWEAEGLRFFNRWPDWLEPGLWVLQQFGVVVAPLLAGLVVARHTRNWWYLLPFALILPLKLGIEKAVVKQLVDRQRPFVSVGPEIDVRGSAFEGPSFPSGHTTTAFAMAVLLCVFLPRRWWPLPLTWAALVGVSRLYHGEHNVLDVVAGAAIGTGLATIVWLVVVNRLIKRESESARPVTTGLEQSTLTP